MKPAPGGETKRRRRAYRLGLSAERLAAWLLRLKGYRILARRHTRGTAELDLIARRGRTLVFVEVKARGTLDAGMAAVSPQQRRRILRAAEGFLAASPEHRGCDIRFDVIVVPPGRLPHHIRAAFDATR